MAMVTISNGTIVSTVPRKMFEKKFKKYGWREVRSAPERSITYADEPVEPDIDTIPISDMNSDQLKQFARSHDIDISKTKSASEARKVIQAVMRNKNM